MNFAIVRCHQKISYRDRQVAVNEGVYDQPNNKLHHASICNNTATHWHVEELLSKFYILIMLLMTQ